MTDWSNNSEEEEIQRQNKDNFLDIEDWDGDLEK